VTTVDAVVACRGKVVAALLATVHAAEDGWVVIVITDVD